MVRTVFLILVALTAAQAWGRSASWFKFDDRATSSSFTDLDRVTRDSYGNQTFRAWWLTSYKKTQVAMGLKYDSTIELYRVDCASGGMALLQITARDVKDNFVWNGGAQRESIALPDTIGETFVQLICAHAKSVGL